MTASLRMAMRLLLRQANAADVRVLLFALVLAVSATTSVAFFTDRIEAGLVRQGGLLLGGDLMVSSGQPLDPAFQHEARSRALEWAETKEFPSMVVHEEQSQLAEIKAVSEAFPLRGELVTSQQLAVVGVTEQAMTVKNGPEQGTVWLEPRLAMLLEAQVGDTIDVGESQLKVSAILEREASRGGDMFSFAPRLMMHDADVSATGLIQTGSRVRYQLLVAGEPASIYAYKRWAEDVASQGVRVQDVSTARPEIRSALEKAQQFLSLAAMVGVILAMVAMLIASLPYLQRSLDAFALMRCLGASSTYIRQILLWQTAIIGLIGSLIGCLLGYLAQAGLAYLAGTLFLESLPQPGWMPLFTGLLMGLLTLLAIVWPHLRALENVPALRILRRDVGNLETGRWLSYLPTVLIVSGMIFWHAGSIKLGVATVVGLIGLLLVTGGVAWLGYHALHRLPDTRFNAWRLGLAGLRRRPLMAVSQVVGFSMGLMALILLALVRGDLLNNWQASLPPDAPNRFIINIQPHQVDAVSDFFKEANIAGAEIFPMVRGRLISVNEQPLDTTQYQDERARRLAEREFNLSWAASMQSDNQMLAGRWWTVDEHGQPQVSLEQDLADTLGLKLGDKLTYDIAGSLLTVEVTSIRKVEWDTMRANFFAVVPPGLLEDFPASYITSFHLPLGNDQLLNELVKRFSNLTIIDVAALMEQVRGIMERMSHAVEYVFLFSLVAGFAVLYAALVATRDERAREATLLRVLGASSRQVSLAGLAEFACIGLLSAIVATLAANLLAYFISDALLNIAFHLNISLSLSAIVSSVLVIPLIAWAGLRNTLHTPPKRVINST